MDSINDIKQLLLRLNNQVTRLDELKHDLPQIEIDITLELLRRMYEQIILVKEIKAFLEPLVETKDDPDYKPEEPAVLTQELAESIIEPVIETVVEPVIETVIELVTESVTEPIVPVPPEDLIVETKVIVATIDELQVPDNNLAEPEPIEPLSDIVNEQPIETGVQELIEEPKVQDLPQQVQKETVKTNKPPLLDLFANETLADKFKDNGQSLADRIMEQKKDKSVAEKIQAGKITDIKSVIGINEKFLFINKLFDGSLKDYNNALENLNKFETQEQVNNYLKLLSESLKWDLKNPALTTFRDLISRRFS